MASITQQFAVDVAPQVCLVVLQETASQLGWDVTELKEWRFVCGKLVALTPTQIEIGLSHKHEYTTGIMLKASMFGWGSLIKSQTEAEVRKFRKQMESIIGDIKRQAEKEAKAAQENIKAAISAGLVCPICGNLLPEGARFCPADGTPIAKTCPKCNHGNPPSARYCANCRTEL